MVVDAGTVRAKVTADTKSFTRGMGSVIGSLKGAGVAFAAFAGAKGVMSAVQASAKFEKRLQEINTLIKGDATQSVRSFRREINTLVQEMPQDSDDLARSAYDVVSAGIKETSNQLNVLRESTKLATAGLGSTQQAVDLMTTAINSFGVEASEADKVAEVFFQTVNEGKTRVSELANMFGQVAPLAEKVGISLEEIQTVTVAMTRRTGNATKAQRGMRQILNSLLKPSKQLSEIYKELGVNSITQLVEKTGTLRKSLELIKRETNGNINQFAKAIGSSRSLSSALLALSEDGQEYTRVIRKMKSDTEGMDSAVDEINSSLSGQTDLLTNKLAVAWRNFGKSITPTAETGISRLDDAVQRLGSSVGLLESRKEKLKKMIEDMNDEITEMHKETFTLVRANEDLKNELVNMTMDAREDIKAWKHVDIESKKDMKRTTDALKNGMESLRKEYKNFREKALSNVEKAQKSVSEVFDFMGVDTEKLAKKISTSFDTAKTKAEEFKKGITKNFDFKQIRETTRFVNRLEDSLKSIAPTAGQGLMGNLQNMTDLFRESAKNNEQITDEMKKQTKELAKQFDFKEARREASGIQRVREALRKVAPTAGRGLLGQLQGGGQRLGGAGFRIARQQQLEFRRDFLRGGFLRKGRQQELQRLKQGQGGPENVNTEINVNLQAVGGSGRGAGGSLERQAERGARRGLKEFVEQNVTRNMFDKPFGGALMG